MRKHTLIATALATAAAGLGVAGLAAADVITCTAGGTCRGTQGPDELTGTAVDDNIVAKKGDDSVAALEGNDVVNSGRGDDRSEERRVGKECFVPCRSRWSPYH